MVKLCQDELYSVLFLNNFWLNPIVVSNQQMLLLFFSPRVLFLSQDVNNTVDNHCCPYI